MRGVAERAVRYEAAHGERTGGLKLRHSACFVGLFFNSVRPYRGIRVTGFVWNPFRAGPARLPGVLPLSRKPGRRCAGARALDSLTPTNWGIGVINVQKNGLRTTLRRSMLPLRPNSRPAAA
jgi:hypothetical protein